jgi:hypothetical protein
MPLPLLRRRGRAKGWIELARLEGSGRRHWTLRPYNRLESW